MNTSSQESQIIDIPPEIFVDKVSTLIKNTLDKTGWVLSCENIELTAEEVSAKDGLLPLVMWITGQTLETIWGPQDLVFRCDSAALCGVVPDLRRPVLSQSIWLHAIHFELDRITKQTPEGPAIIDTWFARWNDALNKKKILLLPPKISSPNMD